MKKLLLALLTFSSITASAQLNASMGKYTQYTLLAQSRSTAYSNSDYDYFIINRKEAFDRINTVIAVDNTGVIKLVKDIRVPVGSFSDDHYIKNIVLAGKNLTAFIETRTKATGKNTLSMRTIDKYGNLSPESLTAGDFDFTKMGNSGSWYITATPDQKHIAAIAMLPHEKDKPNLFKYFFIDENLKVTAAGQFTDNSIGKKDLNVKNIYASDKGDLYIVSEEMEKGYTYPTVYKSAVELDHCTVLPVNFPDANAKNFNYMAAVNPTGQLVLAGYLQEKRAFTTDNITITGTYLFNSANPQETKINKFEPGRLNLNIRNILFNGETTFIVSEEYKVEKLDNPNKVSLGNDLLAYSYSNLLVSGFDAAGVKKFDADINRKRLKGEYRQTYMVASGIFKNKLLLVYNDNAKVYGKSRDNLLPLTLSIDNAGQMSQPATYDKQMGNDVEVLSEYFSFGADRIVVLTNGIMDGINAVTFK